MHELMMNPAIQSGVLPFVVALVLGLLLRRLGWYWTGLALLGGFIVVVYLTVGFQFQPWSSTRKIIALGFGATLLGMLLDIYPWSRRWLPVILFSCAVAAALWLVWPVAQRQEGVAGWILAIVGGVYAGWCVVAMESLRAKAIPAAMATIAMGFGSGAVTLLGASALLGQFGIALGASAGALGILVTFMRKMALGSLTMLPAGVLLSLIGLSGHVYAKVPWYSLALLAWVPICARIPVSTQWPKWLQSVSVLVLAGMPAGIAAWLVWRVAGGVPL